MKTMKQWKESKLPIEQFFTVGDVVDDEVFDYFLGVLPPACWSSQCLQIGEPYSHAADGRPTFETLIKKDDQWIYAGHIPSPDGETCLYRD